MVNMRRIQTSWRRELANFNRWTNASDLRVPSFDSGYLEKISDHFVLPTTATAPKFFQVPKDGHSTVNYYHRISSV